MIRETLAHLLSSGDDRCRETPEPGDVAVLAGHPSYHDPFAMEVLDEADVKYVPKGVARATLGLKPCRRCCESDLEPIEVRDDD